MVAPFRWVLNRLVLALLFLVAMCSCASDRRIVRNAVAAREYYFAKYSARCFSQVIPANCKPCQAAANDLKREIQAANEAQKDGKLPKRARQALKEGTANLSKVCP